MFAKFLMVALVACWLWVFIHKVFSDQDNLWPSDCKLVDLQASSIVVGFKQICTNSEQTTQDGLHDSHVFADTGLVVHHNA